MSEYEFTEAEQAAADVMRAEIANEGVITTADAESFNRVVRAIAAAVQQPTEKAAPCGTCEGCGQVADTLEQEPWTAWESLPPGSDMAVRMGLVLPVPCPSCGGK